MDEYFWTKQFPVVSSMLPMLPWFLRPGMIDLPVNENTLSFARNGAGKLGSWRYGCHGCHGGRMMGT